MSKYFSYDAIDVNLYVHDTAEEAKQSALDIAEDGYNLSSYRCDGLSKGSQDLIKSICYGVILGGIDLPVRQTSVEQDGADAVAKFKYMVQPPVIVEYEQNNVWIKCSDRLPNVMPNIEVEDSHPNLLLCCKLDDGSLSIEQGWYSDLVEEDQPKFFTMWINSEHTSYDFRTDTPEVTHWMPLPELPKDYK